MAVDNTPRPFTTNPSPAPQAPDPAETPQFSGDALAGLVTNAVRTVIDERAQVEQKKMQDAQMRQAQLQANQGIENNPVYQTIAPVIGPALQAVALKADAAMDAVHFYAANPEAGKYKNEVEELFQGEMNRGRPTDRQSLWYFFQGNPQNAQRLAKDREEASKQLAMNSANLGPTAVGRSDNSMLTLAPDTPVQDMRDALKGRSF